LPYFARYFLTKASFLGVSRAALYCSADMSPIAKGVFPGPDQFVAKMAALKVDTADHHLHLVREPRGPVSFDDMRNPVHNIYIKKVEKKKMFGYDKDELWNTVIKTYPNVSQFWTCGKEAFLKQPVYSRDFPPCKFCQ
jgi:branched-chain amino acid transport system substrate-binding protein